MSGYFCGRTEHVNMSAWLLMIHFTNILLYIISVKCIEQIIRKKALYSLLLSLLLCFNSVRASCKGKHDDVCLGYNHPGGKFSLHI